MAPMNMSVGLDLSQLQKDLKVLDKDLNSVTGQEKVVKIRPIIETTKINQATGEVEKCAREGFEPLYKSIKRLEEAQKGLHFSVNDNLFNVSTMKEAQRYLTQLRKEFNTLEKNGGMTVDLRRQYTDGISALAEWQKATKEATKQLGQFGFIDYDKEAGKIKALRREYSKEMKAIMAEMSGLSDTAPRDLARREQLLTRLISLQEKYNSTYKSASSQKRQIVTDLRAERDSIRLKQAEATIQARINSLENDRANAKNLTKKISQIQAERSAVGKLISSYEQLAARQRKLGANSSTAEQRVAMLKQEHIALKNLEAEERARQKAVNQNNALFNDQRKVFEKLWTVASRYISIFTLWNFGQKIIDTTGYFQQQQVALEGILGSASKAEKAIQRIRNMALNSPKTTYELVGYTKQLAAYNVGDQDPDKLLDTVHQLAELSTGLGVDMQRLILAYGQVNAASVLRGQELRQFTEAGIPMVQALADKFTQLNGRLVTTGEVFELISKRQVSFEMVASVLRDMTAEGGKFNEMQSRITDTLYGQKQKLKDLWTINLDKLGKSTGGLLMNIVSALQGIVKNIRPIANSILTFSFLKTAAKLFSTIVILSGSLNRNLAHAQWQMRNFYRQVRAASGAMATMKAIARGITSGGVVGAAFNAAFLALPAVVGLIVKARQKTKEWHRTLSDINVSFAKDTYALTSGVDKLIGKLHNAAATSKDYKEILDTLKSNYGEYLNDGIIQQLELEAKNAESTANSWGKLSDAIKEAIIAKKEYERHDTRRSTAIDNIMKDLDGEMKSTIRRAVKDNSSGEFVSSNKNGVKQIEYKTTYNEVAEELRKKDANGAIMSAVREFLDRGFINASDLQPLLESQMLRYGFSMKTASDIGGRYESIFNKIKNAQGYDVYSEETGYINTSLQNMLNNVFDAATESISKNYKNYTGVRDGNGSYNPFGIQEFQNKSYIGALRQVFESKDFQRYIPKEVTDALKKDKDFLSAISMSDADEGKTKALSDAITSFVKNADGITPQVAKNIHQVVSDFIRLAGTNGVDAARVRTHMGQYMYFGNLSDDEKDFINRFKPTDQNIESMISSIAAEYQEMHDFNEKLRSTDPNATFNEKYKSNERLMSLLDILALQEYYNQGSWLKKSGTGGSKGDFTRFFADLFGMLKSAYNEQKKFIEGPQGVTNSLISSINSLSDDNILKGFYKEGVNPFQKFLDKIEDYDINTIFSAGDFKSLVNTFRKDVGVDKISVADFENMWEQLLAVVRKKAVDLRAAGKDKEASKIEAYLQTMTAEGLKFFGRDEINNKIDAAIKSLTNIEEAARTNSAQYQDMIAMMKTGNYKQIYGLFNPGKEYRDIDEANVAKQTLAQMLSPETKGGAGMASFIGKDMENILKSEQLGLSFIPELYAIISKIGKIGDELKDENGRVIDAKELQKVKDAFIKALKDLINGIKTETQKLSETRTKQETTTDKMYEAQQKYIDKINLLNKAHEIGITEIVDGKEKTVKIDDDTFVDRTTEALQEFTKNLTELLGGQYNSNIAQITGDAGSKTGSSSGGNFMQMLSSMQNGGLQSVIGTGLGQSAAGGMDMGAAAGAAGTAGGIIKMIDMIVKAIYGAIKGMVDMGKATLKVMKSFDDVKEVNIDKTGIMHVKTVYGGYDFEKAEAILDTIQQTNQHAMDGWEKLKNGDPIGATAEIYSGIMDLISSIRNIEDMDEQRKIEALEDSATDLRNAATNLNASAERLVGFAKIQKELQAIGTNASLASEYKEMIRIEDSKKKSDGDKMREWQQQYEQAMNEFLNGIRKIRNEMVNSTEEWADAMGSAIRSAFQNGENAARAFRDTVKTMMGDVIERMLQMAIIEPLMESILQEWTNSDYLNQKYTKTWVDENGITRKSFDQDNYLKEAIELITDPDRANKAYDAMVAVGDMVIDTINELPAFWKDAYMHNSELGTLSGGIESVTEDTARRIEALENSQLGEVFAIRTMLQNYLEGSGFGDSMTADLQAAIVSIASDTNLIRIATESILSRIDQMRNSNVQPLHVTIV